MEEVGARTEAMKNTYLECGKIVNTHGVRGDITIESYCDSREVFCALKKIYLLRAGTYVPVTVLRAAPHKNVVLASLEGIDSIEAAQVLKGTILYADRADIPLPEGGYFIADLLGLPVYDADSGRKYGVIASADETAGRMIYSIDTPSGRVLFPAAGPFIVRCDVDNGLYIRPIEGFFDEI